MRIELVADAAAFLEATSAYRGGDPLRTNVMGSVATSVIKESRRYEDARWWVVRDDGGDAVGAAFRTPPFPLSLGPMPSACADALAPVVAAVDDAFTVVNGPAVVVDAFLDAYRRNGSPGSKRRMGWTRRDVLRALGQLRVPTVPGEPRVTREAELDLVESWFIAFAEEVDGESPQERSREGRDVLATKVRLDRFLWWCRDGAPVSMAGFAPPVETPLGVVARIGPVYTPPSERRNGYAAAVTAELSERLLATGARVMLFSDEANATSNGVYAALGFEVVDVFVRHSLEA